MSAKNDLPFHMIAEASQVTSLDRRRMTPLEPQAEVRFPLNALRSFINEGLPEGSNISLSGPPGVGKTIFCESLANDLLRQGVSCLYVSLDKAPDDIRSDFQKLGTNLGGQESKRRVVFVDGFSWLMGSPKEGYYVENLANLTELSIRISSAACELDAPVLLVFDSVSPLAVYNPEVVVVKFLQILLARMKEWRGMGLYIIQEGVHNEEFYNTLGYLVDGVFDMKMEEENGEIRRYFRIRCLKSMSHETKWMPFVIQPDRSFELKERRGTRK